MTIKEMKDKIVASFGMEAPETISFFRACEKGNISYIVRLYKILERMN